MAPVDDVTFFFPFFVVVLLGIWAVSSRKVLTFVPPGPDRPVSKRLVIWWLYSGVRRWSSSISDLVHPVFCLSFVISTWVTCMSYFTEAAPSMTTYFKNGLVCRKKGTKNRSIYTQGKKNKGIKMILVYLCILVSFFCLLSFWFIWFACLLQAKASLFK